MAATLDEVTSVRILTVTVMVRKMGQFDEDKVWDDLTFHPRRKDSLSRIFEPEPAQRRSTSLYVPLVFEGTDGAPLPDNGAAIAAELGDSVHDR